MWARLLIILGLLLFGHHAAAEPRLALVIGNGDYSDIGALANPVNDADLISRTLKSLEFQVTDARNLNSVQLRATVLGFLQAAERAGPEATLLLYYAGHGVQMGEENYLVPTDASSDSTATTLNLNAFKLSDYMNNIPSLNVAASIIILDACRNNPFSAEVRGSARGLALVRENSGTVPTFIMFATAPGKVAEDGIGSANSPFTTALAENLVRPGETIEVVGRRVSAAVYTTTNHRQDPWVTNNIKAELFLVPEGRAIVPVATPPPASLGVPGPGGQTQRPGPASNLTPPVAADSATLEVEYLRAVRINTVEVYEGLLTRYPNHPRKEEVFALIRMLDDEARWRSVSTAHTVGEYRLYLQLFPNGIYIEEARKRIGELTSAPTTSDVPVVVPPTPPTLVPDGIYVGYRGYTGAGRPSQGRDCKADYGAIQINVQAGHMTFYSDGRTWRGTVNPQSGYIQIDYSGILPQPKNYTYISGSFNSAEMYNGYCGMGYFRMSR